MRHRDLERLLTSVSVLRVVAALSSSMTPMSAYAVAHRAALHRTSTARTLRKLCRVGWVIEDNTYTPTRYRLNMDNEHVKVLVEMLQKTGYTSKFR